MFDGVDSDDVHPMMPTTGARVIFTSRDPTWEHDNSIVGFEVPAFTDVEAQQFLQARDGQLTDQQVASLLREVGRVPLELEQVTASRQATGVSWDGLLSRLGEPGTGLMSSGQPDHYPHTVASALRLALSQLATVNPVAGQALELFAAFGSEPVAVSWLGNGLSGGMSGPLPQALNDQVRRRRTLADICRYGLARLHQQPECIAVQPMVRLALRELLSPEELERAEHNVHDILAAADPGRPDDLGSMKKHREIAAHVRPAGMVRSRLVKGQQTVYHQIRYRYLVGEYAEACSLGEAAVSLWGGERFLGPDHQLVLRTTRHWANALRALGRYRQAHDLTADALSRLRADPEYGDDHTYTLAMSGSHAADLRIVGEYRRALEVTEGTYRRCAERFGETDGRTTKNRHNLAVSLRLIGDFRSAEAVDREALANHRQLRGEDDWQTLLSINSLAEDLYGLGRYDEVLTLQSRDDDSDRRARDEDGDRRPPRPMDRGVLLAARTVALARRGLGELDEARELLRAHYEKCVELFGDDHEYTLAAMTSYANTLCQCGEADQAQVQAKAAVATYRRIFGPRNPLTLATEINLATILRAVGERGQARGIDAVASETLRDTVGDEHPFTIAAMVNLATDYSLTGNHLIARTLSERAHTTARLVRGPDHPDTMVAAVNLILDLTATGAAGSANTLRDSVLARLHQTVGAEHPTTIGAVHGVRLECPVEPPST